MPMHSIVIVPLFALSIVSLVYATGIFDFSVVDSEGKAVFLSLFSDKRVIVIVNVASECGYTHHHYRELVQMQDEYGAQGLQVLGFPCNQFGLQEPGDDKQIQSFVKSHAVNFPVFSKIEVNGKNSHPLFKYLKSKTGQTEIAWNFNKFLVIDGIPVKRYPPTISPKKMEEDILFALQKTRREEL